MPWAREIDQLGIGVAVLVFCGVCIVYVGIRVFGRGGWLSKMSDRCIGENGIFTAYVQNNEKLCGALKDHVDKTGQTLGKISESQEKVAATCERISKHQEEVTIGVTGLTKECEGTHVKILRGLYDQHTEVKEKIEALANQQNDPEHRLVSAAKEACNQLKFVAKRSGIDCQNEIDAVQKKLESS